MLPMARCWANIPRNAVYICRSRRFRKWSSTPFWPPRTRISTSTAASIFPAWREPPYLRAELRLQPPAAGRIHDHATGREELSSDQRGVVHAQDQGGLAGNADRTHLLQ